MEVGIRIGTRSSPLALVQARAVGTELEAHGATVTIVPMRTAGDRLADTLLATVGGKGLFVRDIETALLRKEIDVAVHSLKDLPAETPAGLAIVAYPPREDPRDVLVTRSGGRLASLPHGAVIGTSSPRRKAMVLSLRPDAVVEPIRGNVDTRLRKLDAGDFDAVILAAAGLRRLGLTLDHAEPLDTETFVPAVGQGILGIEARDDDASTREMLTALDHPPTRACAAAERAYLARLGASCVTPMAAHAFIDGPTLRMIGLVASEDGRRVLRRRANGPLVDAVRLGTALADALLADGAASLTALRPVGRT